MGSDLQSLFPGGLPRPGAVYLNRNSSLLIPLQSDVFYAGEVILSLDISSSTHRQIELSPQTNAENPTLSNVANLPNTPVQNRFEHNPEHSLQNSQPQIRVRRRLILNHFLEIPIRSTTREEQEAPIPNEDPTTRSDSGVQPRYNKAKNIQKKIFG
jgi:hypothetical protein